MKQFEQTDKVMYIIGWILLAVAAVTFIVIGILGVGVLSQVTRCPFHEITGLYCPGCGGTRAVFALLRGQVIRSFIFNPIIIYIVVVGAIFMISQTIYRLAKGKIRFVMHFRGIYLWIALGIIVLNFIVKNVLIMGWGIYLLG